MLLLLLAFYFFIPPIAMKPHRLVPLQFIHSALSGIALKEEKRMSEITAQLYPCRHCEETGTCKNGENGSSCQVCVKNHELKGKLPFHGLACGTCGGIGQAEPITDRMNKRIKPMLALGIVFLVLICTFVLAAFKNQYFSEFLAFSGTLMGAITAFYFNNSRSS